ncbi:MAG: hypothetical protein LBS60_09095 [Deltaproteobacteria bacterium]|nr:hypothetical protein [Deltaproteobacteria bacterium]
MRMSIDAFRDTRYALDRSLETIDLALEDRDKAPNMEILYLRSDEAIYLMKRLLKELRIIRSEN